MTLNIETKDRLGRKNFTAFFDGRDGQLNIPGAAYSQFYVTDTKDISTIVYNRDEYKIEELDRAERDTDLIVFRDYGARATLTPRHPNPKFSQITLTRT